MKNLLKIYLITLPLNAFLFEINIYEIKVPLIITALISILAIIIRRKIDRKLLIVYLIFTFWLFFITFSRYGFDNYIFSIIQFILMSLPVLVNYKEIEVKDFTKYLLIGFYVTIPFALYDLGLDLPFENLVRERTGPSRPIYEGIIRTRATFTEPSYYAIYLNAVLYALVDRKKPPNRYAIPLVLFFILTTFSFGGYILSLFIGFQRILKKKINILYISLIFSLIILFNPILIERLLIRIDLAIYVILNNDLYGSEGSRLNSLYVMYEYLSSGTVTQFLFGEGFPYYADYLRRMFGSDPLLQYSDGAIFNTFAVVGISAGSIGLSIYLYLLNNIRKSKYIKTEYMIFFIILHFAYAGLQSYFLWSILLILKLNNTSRSFVESHRLIKKK